MGWGCLHKDLPLKSVEADFGEGPVTIYFRDLNIRQRKMIAADMDKSHTDAVVTALIVRARDGDGLAMFKEADRDRIETQYDPDEVDRVVIAMNQRDEPAGN